MIDQLTNNLNEVAKRTNVSIGIPDTTLIKNELHQLLNNWMESNLISDYIIYIRNTGSRFNLDTSLSWIDICIKFDGDELFSTIRIDID